MIDPKTPKAWANALAKMWGKRFPVDVNQIALEYTQTACKSEPIHKIASADVSEFEGALYKSGAKSRWYVLYNPNIGSPGRINFTIAHELGHYLLHRASVNSFECSQRDLIDYGGNDSVKREEEANVFASYLLMPLDDFREQIGNETISLDLLGHCADRYNVSLTAAALKWLEYTDQRAVLVVSRDEFILWARSSRSAFSSGVFYRKGTPVPETSLAVLNASTTAEQRNGVELTEGVWRPNEAVREMRIVSDQYDLTISLLLLPKHAPPRYYEEEPVHDFVDDIGRLFRR